MSYPAAYLSSASPQLGVPAMLNSDPLLQFKGARSIVKSIPASTGSAVGPGTAVQFQIPMSTNGYIKPNSMYLRFRIDVTLDNTVVGANGAWWMFGGQNGSGTAPGPAIIAGQGTGGAGSVIDRATVMFPGGVTMTYNNYSHFRNAIVGPHCLSPDFVDNDLRILESAGCIRDCSYSNVAGVNARSKAGYFVHPLDLPVFNSASAVPLLLLTGGITLEILTASLVMALYTGSTTDAPSATSYALSEMSLVYEELVVSPEFKSELIKFTQERPYSIGIADRTPLGIFDGASSIRINVGVGLSSVKAVVATQQVPINSVATPKSYYCNAMNRWNLYLNGQQITTANLDNEPAVYAEFQRALARLFDHRLVSNVGTQRTYAGSTEKSLYCKGQFAFGASTAVYDDAAFALSGVPVDQIAVEIERYASDTQDRVKWGVSDTTDNLIAGTSLFLWALHDSVLTILPDGTVSIRK